MINICCNKYTLGYIILIVAAAAAVAVCVGAAAAEDGPNAGDPRKCGDGLTWEYTDSDRTLTISGSGAMDDFDLAGAPWHSYSGRIAAISLPEGLTHIGDYAFLDLSCVGSVEIPGTVVSVGGRAFFGCVSLTSVILPDSVKTIGDYVFSYCDALTSVTLSYSLETIGEGAFENSPVTELSDYSMLCIAPGDSGLSENAAVTHHRCGNGLTWEYDKSSRTLTVSGSGAMNDYYCEYAPWHGYVKDIRRAVLPNGLTDIGSFAFMDMSALESVVIPNTVVSIGREAFYGCVSLTSVTIPSSVTAIGDHAFILCPMATVYNLSELDIGPGDYGLPSNVKIVTGCGDDLLWEYDNGSRTLTVRGSGPMDDFVLGGSPWCRFSDDIINVVLPEGLTHIGCYAFSDLCSLRTVSVPDSVVSIGEGAFFFCPELVSVSIPDSVETIGGHAFYRCGSLTSVSIPDSVKTIGFGAFYGCGALASLSVFGNVETIGDGAFAGCPVYALFNYSGMDIAPGDHGLPDDVLIFTDRCGDSVFGKFVESERKLVIGGTGEMYDYGRGGTPWYGRSGDIAFLELPDGLTSIGSYAFSDLSALKTVMIPETVGSIGEGAFCGCGALTAVRIPRSAGSIGADAFADCPLSTVYNYSDVYIRPGDCGIPDRAEIFSRCGNGLLWHYYEDGHKLSIIGSGSMYDYLGTGAPWHGYSGYITDVEMPYGLSHIGNYAFSDMTALETVTIPEDVDSIGKGAFCGCSALTSVSMPYSLRTVGGYAFYKCSSLGFVNIPGNVVSIGSYAFYGSALDFITIPRSVETMGSNVFACCPAIVVFNYSDIDLSSGYGFSKDTLFAGKCGEDLFWYLGKDDRTLHIVGFGAMYDYYYQPPWYDGEDYTHLSIRNIVLPDGLTHIGNRAFEYLDSLSSVSIPETVESIGDHAFYDCDGLTDVTISAKTIGYCAFSECNVLTKVTLSGSVKSINGTAFDHSPIKDVYNYSRINLRPGDCGLDADCRIHNCKA